MGIRRLAISNPSATTDTSLYTADNQYLMSIISTNKSSSTPGSIRIWVEPFGSSTSAEYSYIVYDLVIDASNAYESFRFAVNQGDVVKVRASTANLSFAAYGIIQLDVNIGLGVSSYSSTTPFNPIQGQLWYDSGTSHLKVYNGTTWTTIV